ncbi:MAG: peptidase S1, partial [Acidobacteria bacterium]
KSGVIVSNVRAGGPADQAGIKQGDAITSVDGKPVKNGDELVGEISGLKPGSKATLAFLRNGKPQEATVTIADRAKLYSDLLGENEGGPESPAPTESKLGLSVGNLTPDVASRLGTPPGKGVIVQDVKNGSFADEDLGLQRGDVILEVNRKPVNSEEDFRKVQAELKSGEAVALLIHPSRSRPGTTVFAAGTLP